MYKDNRKRMSFALTLTSSDYVEKVQEKTGKNKTEIINDCILYAMANGYLLNDNDCIEMHNLKEFTDFLNRLKGVR